MGAAVLGATDFATFSRVVEQAFGSMASGAEI